MKCRVCVEFLLKIYSVAATGVFPLRKHRLCFGQVDVSPYYLPRLISCATLRRGTARYSVS